MQYTPGRPWRLLKTTATFRRQLATARRFSRLDMLGVLQTHAESDDSLVAKQAWVTKMRLQFCDQHGKEDPDGIPMITTEGKLNQA